MGLKAFFIFLLFIIICPFQRLQARMTNVLILHSYNSGLSWTDGINKGIFESFENEYYRTIDLRCEFMDSKHFESNDYFQNIKSYLKYKYSNIPIDLIICSDNPAFDFLSLYHRELFGNTPVVFCGLNYCDSIPKGFTGIMEDVDLSANLSLITSIHPKYHKLYIINDKSITGRSITRELNKTISKKFPQLKYEYLTDYSLKELKQKLTTLTPDDVVFMLLFNFDRLGTPYSYDVILDLILPSCKAPVYGPWDFYLNKGIVGGKITDAYNHGLLVSAISKEILRGKAPSTIPVFTGPTKYMFDYKVLKKFGISRSLPAQSEIINLPYNFIYKNKKFFVLLGVIMLLLIVIIILLFWQVHRAKKNLEIEQDLVSTIEEKSAELEKALGLAEESSRLKSAFISNISHEIRTPMNGILGFIGLLKESDDPNARGDYIKIIRNCSDQLLTIINDILNISLIDSGQIKLHEHVVSLNQTIQELFCIFEEHREVENKTLQASLFFANGDDYIYTDKTKLKQILTNLISNALKFTKEGTITVSYVVANGCIEFSIRDSGIGISPEHQELIFERFRQVNQGNTKLYGGNGLGLSISRAYVELMDGKIWLESTPGKGSTFFFTIPYSKAKEPM